MTLFIEKSKLQEFKQKLVVALTQLVSRETDDFVKSLDGGQEKKQRQRNFSLLKSLPDITYSENDKIIFLKPNKFLGTNWQRYNEIVKDHGGIWLSLGKEGRWEIRK